MFLLSYLMVYISHIVAKQKTSVVIFIYDLRLIELLSYASFDIKFGLSHFNSLYTNYNIFSIY